MHPARLIRSRRFTARHHYGRAEWSAERNREVFGEQVDAHEHDWTVEIRVVGPIDPVTGFSVDLGEVDGALDSVMGGWSGADLNAVVPPVRHGRMMPSTEALARYLFEQLEGRLTPPSRLELVRVFESPDLGSEYPATAQESAPR